MVGRATVFLPICEAPYNNSDHLITVHSIRNVQLASILLNPDGTGSAKMGKRKQFVDMSICESGLSMGYLEVPVRATSPGSIYVFDSNCDLLNEQQTNHVTLFSKEPPSPLTANTMVDAARPNLFDAKHVYTPSSDGETL